MSVFTKFYSPIFVEIERLEPDASMAKIMPFSRIQCEEED